MERIERRRADQSKKARDLRFTKEQIFALQKEIHAKEEMLESTAADAKLIEGV